MELFLRRKDRTGPNEDFRKSVATALGREDEQDHQFESPSKGGKLLYSKGMNQIDANEPAPNYKPSIFKQDDGDSIYSGDKTITTPDMTERDPSATKLFGMDRPERATPKWYDYVAGIGIPAILGGLSGEGAVQGGLLGLSDVLKSRAGRSQQQVSDWEKDRSFGQKEREIQADADLAARKLGVDAADKSFDRKLKLQELGIKKNPVRAKGPYDPDASEERAYQSLSPEEINHLSKATPDQLMKYMAAPDESMRKAAKHVWKLQRASKQLPDPIQQFMLDQMDPNKGQ